MNWYDAVAFCRWLSVKFAFEVRLPTEQEWERAARGRKGREYAYAGKFDPAKANTNETGIGQTSAVGIFPDGASEDGVMDLMGEVWEWCLNEYDKPEKMQLTGTENRVVRGGSWSHAQNDARAAVRDRYYAVDRYSGNGFRVVCGSVPIS